MDSLHRSLVMYPERSVDTIWYSTGTTLTLQSSKWRIIWNSFILRMMSSVISTLVNTHRTSCTTWKRSLLWANRRNRISKMDCSHWKPPGVSARMCSVNLDASISGEYQTVGGHFCWPSEWLGAPTRGFGAPGSYSDKPGNASDNSQRISNHCSAVYIIHHLLLLHCCWAWNS
jgi:hypothetical protein